jgi:hypothetical protein
MSENPLQDMMPSPVACNALLGSPELALLVSAKWDTPVTPEGDVAAAGRWVGKANQRVQRTQETRVAATPCVTHLYV